jgi:hypothetical protein
MCNGFPRNALKPPLPSSTVKISVGALAALKEARETPAQTAKGATRGRPRGPSATRDRGS